MPINSKDTPLTDAQVTEITDSIGKIKTALKDVLAGYTNEERISIQSLSNTRYPFAKRAITVHAPNNPSLVPAFRPLPDAENSLKLFDQLAALIPLIVQVNEMMVESQQKAGHNSYEFLRLFYGQCKAGSEAGVPGADTPREDIGGLFEGQGDDTPPPPTE